MRSLIPLAVRLVLLAPLALAGCDSSPAVPDAASGDAAAPDAAAATDAPAVTCTVAPVAISHDAELPGAARKHLVELAGHPLAVCNDGTPASYTLRPGVGQGRKRWVIFLKGGGQCSTSEDCASRFTHSPGLMSSAGVVDGASDELSGILSASPDINPDFYDANTVEIAYCSSDWHTGDRAGDAAAPTSELAHWQFRGRAIVRAVLEELDGSGLAAANEVLLAGGSAGAVGASSLADDVRAALPATTRLVSLADAAYVISYPAYDPATRTESTARPTPPEQLAVEATAAWGGRGDASCYDVAPIGEHVACRAEAYLFPRAMVAVPTMIRQSQLDVSQLGRLIDDADHSAEADAFRERFAAELRAQLAQVVLPHAVFSRHDDAHTAMTSNDLWTSTKIGDASLRGAVGGWYRAPCTPLRIIE